MNFHLKTILVFFSVVLFIPFIITAQNISGIVNTYYKVLAIDVATNRVKLNTVAGLSFKDRVLLIQMKGATASTNNNSTFGNITSSGYAGLYEFNEVCAFHNDTIVLRENILNNYDASGYLQLVRVPQYTNVTVADTLKAQAWDVSTGTGGVLAIEATGSITLNSGIYASGLGFAGGTLYNFGGTCASLLPATAYYYDLVPDDFGSGAYKGEGIAATISGKQCGKGKFANAGGGGNNHNAGGAGGSNYGAGGDGGYQSGLSCNGTNTGIGGVSLSAYGYSVANNRLFMGGGGGAGHENNSQGVGGGNGGGIIILRCATLEGNSHTIEANGKQPVNTSNSPSIYEANGDGGGGGGGGGVIVLDVTTVNSAVIAEAKGGDGNKSGFLSQCTGPGGGGGGGVVWVSGGSVPVNVSTSITGGINGVVKVAACINNPNGATAGSNGAVLTNYVAPASGVTSCGALPLTPAINFYGTRNNKGIMLNWSYNEIEATQLSIEKSYNRNNFSVITTLRNNVNTVFSYTDTGENKSCFYRLKMTAADGKIFYSEIIFVKAKAETEISCYPNPASDILKLSVNTLSSQTITIAITDVNGKTLLTNKSMIVSTVSTMDIPVQSLTRGIYFLRVSTDAEVKTIKFTRE